MSQTARNPNPAGDPSPADDLARRGNQPLPGQDATWSLPELGVRVDDHPSADPVDAMTPPSDLPPSELFDAHLPLTEATPRPSPQDVTLDATMAAPKLPPRPASSAGLPETVGENYRVMEKIGEGGMGVVYRAVQLYPVRRTVAVKVIRVGMDTQEVVARFEAERQALAMMDHPNVARVLDAGMTAAGRPYFAMEHVPGVPLVQFCDEQRLTVRQRLELFVLVCQAVQHAHQKGIIHRDLKPTNILVAMGDAGPVPKVIDFGIAKAIAEPLTDNDLRTRAGAMIGTPEYASPEQAVTGGMDVDTRTDVYSLGVILYQLLTGTLPLDARTLRQDGPEGIARILREVEPPRPSTRIEQLRRVRFGGVGGGGTGGSGGAGGGVDVDPWEAAKAAGGSKAAGRSKAARGSGGAAAQVAAAEPGSGEGDATFHAVVAARQSDPRSFLRMLSGDLDWITLKAMDKDRTRRYETAHELAADVRRYLADEPILARPPSRWYRVAKFARRYRAAAVATAAMVALLVSGVVGTTTGLVRAVAARADAEAARRSAEAARASAETAKVAAEEERQITAETLVALRAAEALAGEARSAVSKSIEVADGLVETKSTEARRLAELARGTAIAALGPNDPMSLAAGNVLGRALMTAGDQPRAEAVLRDVVGRTRASAAAAAATNPPTTGPSASAGVVPRGRLFADLADVVRQRPAGDSADEAIDLYREGLSIYRATPGRPARAQLDAGERLARLLHDTGRLAESADAYRQTLAEHRAQLSDDHDRTRAVMDQLATVLVEAGEYDAALPYARAQLAHALAKHGGPHDDVVLRQIDVADLLIRGGHRDDGDAACREALATNRLLRGGSDSRSQEWWRQLVMRSGIGSGRLWASPTLRGNLWMIVMDGLMQAKSRSLAVDELQWSAARLRLYPWTGDPAPATRPATAAARATPPTPVFDGSYDEFRRLPDPPPGLYLLAVSLPRAGEQTLKGVAWVLMSPWQLKLFEPIDLDPKDRKRSMWDAIGRSPSGSLEQPSLLMLDEGNEKGRTFGVRIGQGPNGRTTDFAAIATSDLRLPPGPYRFTLTSDDGARAHLGSRTLVNAWEPRATQTNVVAVELAGDREQPVRIEYFQGVNDYVLRLQLEPLSPRADDLMVAAVGADSSDFRRWLTRQGRELGSAHRWEDALAYYRRAVEVGLRQPSWDPETHQQAVRGAVRAYVAMGRAAEAPAFLEDAGSRTMAPEVAAETLLIAARRRAAAGEADAARALAVRAYDLATTGTKWENGPRNRELARKAVLVRLGSTLAPHDGGLAAQFYCALDEAMIEDRSVVPLLRDATPGDVEWALYRWRAKGETLVARGTAADLTGAGGDLPVTMDPGIYLMQLRFAPPGRPARETAHWLLAAQWESAAYWPDGEGMFDRQTYGLIIDALRRPAALADLGGMAAMDALAAEQVPDGPNHRFAVVARARVRRPAGRYRLVGTSTDGLRVSVDDRRVINTWPGRQGARQDVADVELGDLLHGLRVDHYRVGMEDKLWVRLEPLDPAAQALAARLGRRERPEKAVLAEQAEAISKDAYNASALATRGVMHARADRFVEAARDFNAAQNGERGDPLHWQHQLALAAMTGDRAGYQRLAAGYAALKLDWKEKRDGKDRHSAGRMALVLLLDPRAGATPSADVARALAAATTPSPLGGPPAYALAALALQELNAGRPAEAERSAVAARGASPAREHVAMCDLIVALSRQATGKSAEAREAYEAASAAIESWPAAGGPRWDVYAGIDWMVCKTLEARARAAIEGK